MTAGVRVEDSTISECLTGVCLCACEDGWESADVVVTIEVEATSG